MPGTKRQGRGRATKQTREADRLRPDTMAGPPDANTILAQRMWKSGGMDMERFQLASQLVSVPNHGVATVWEYIQYHPEDPSNFIRLGEAARHAGLVPLVTRTVFMIQPHLDDTTGRYCGALRATWNSTSGLLAYAVPTGVSNGVITFGTTSAPLWYDLNAPYLGAVDITSLHRAFRLGAYITAERVARPASDITQGGFALVMCSPLDDVAEGGDANPELASLRNECEANPTFGLVRKPWTDFKSKTVPIVPQGPFEVGDIDDPDHWTDTESLGTGKYTRSYGIFAYDGAGVDASTILFEVTIVGFAVAHPETVQSGVGAVSRRRLATGTGYRPTGTSVPRTLSVFGDFVGDMLPGAKPFIRLSKELVEELLRLYRGKHR